MLNYILKLFGVTGSSLLAVFLLSGLSFVSSHELRTNILSALYETFLASDLGAARVFEQQLDQFISIFDSGELLQRVLLFIIWSGIGVVVFGMLQLLITSNLSVRRVISESHYINAYASRRQEFFERLLLRALIVVIFVIYIRQVLPELLTFSGKLAGVGITSFPSPVSPLLCVLSPIIIFMSLHFIVVLTRLLCLRQRVFKS